MRLLLIAALLAASLSATAETYICKLEKSVFTSTSDTLDKEWVSQKPYYRPVNIVFEKNKETGAIKFINGKTLYECDIKESEKGERTYCSSLNISFILHNVNKHFIMSDIKIDSKGIAVLDYGTCEQFGVGE